MSLCCIAFEFLNPENLECQVIEWKTGGHRGGQIENIEHKLETRYTEKYIRAVGEKY